MKTSLKKSFQTIVILEISLYNTKITKKQIGGKIMADITKNEIMHIAKLAMLNLTDTEIEGYTKDMQEILAYAEMINNLDTSDIDETIGATKQKNKFRKDEVIEFQTRDNLLQNAPSQAEGMFRIPKVINT